MARSKETNALIKKIFQESHNLALIYNEDSGEYDEAANGFRELADQIDSLDRIIIKVVNKFNSNIKGRFILEMMNDGIEQISDYSANLWCEKIYTSIEGK